MGQGTETTSQRGTVLVIDDEPMVRMQLGKIFDGAGLQSVLCGEPDAALDLIASHDVDVVMLDVNMPGTSGIEVCQKIRAAYADLPVIMITGLADERTCQKTISSGANDFIAKPIDAGEALIRIKNALQMRMLQKQFVAQTAQVQSILDQVSRLDHDVHDINGEVHADEKKKRVEAILNNYAPTDSLFDFDTDEEDEEQMIALTCG